MITKFVSAVLLTCSTTSMAYIVSNQTTDPLEVELVTTHHGWAWHQFIIEPGGNYSEPFIEQPDKPTYYRMCIHHSTGLFSKDQRTLSGILHNEKSIIVTFEDNEYVFTVDGKRIIKGNPK